MKTFEEAISRVLCYRRCSAGKTWNDERVIDALRLAYERGAEFDGIAAVVDHKGDMQIYLRESRFGVRVKDIDIIARAWSDSTDCEFYENVTIQQRG